ncbi:hypothetical protein N431DRAFT_475769 [Stipitochalara longipes BDJ]|nr:hypothetical protein N431DRAFT_475769 [Stipitochalara longipes BDJ]
MAVLSLDRFHNDQKSLLQDIKTCNDDLVHHRTASDSLICRSEQMLHQNSTEAVAVTRKLLKLIESADSDLWRQSGSEEWLVDTHGQREEDIELRTEHSEAIAEKYQQDFAVITEAFDSLAERSKTALEDVMGLSRDATVFQVSRVAPVEQQRRTVLKDLQDNISATKQNVDILITKKSVMESEMALENHRASTSGQEAHRQDNNRDTGIIAGSCVSGAAAYTTLGVGLLFGPVGWIIGGIAVATSATTTAIYASEKKERVQRHENERRSHQNAVARLSQELSQASSAMVELEEIATEYRKMGQNLIDMEKDVEELQTSAARHEDRMKQSVNKSTDTYLKMSQAAIEMSVVGYSSDVRAQLLQLASGVSEDENYNDP